MPAAKLTDPSTNAAPCDRASVRIVVRGGFNPHTVALRSGQPHRLIFRREETFACSEELVFPTIGHSVTLPAFEDVAVELPPLAPGSYAFTCGRAAMHGGLAVRRDPPRSGRGDNARGPAPGRLDHERRIPTTSWSRPIL